MKFIDSRCEMSKVDVKFLQYLLKLIETVDVKFQRKKLLHGTLQNVTPKKVIWTPHDFPHIAGDWRE